MDKDNNISPMKHTWFYPSISAILLSIIVNIFIIVSMEYYKSTRESIPIKLLDKNKVLCGYKLNHENNTPYITYYIYDGELYNTNPDSCEKLSKPTLVESIIVMDINEDLKFATVNTIEDRENWFDKWRKIRDSKDK